MKCCKRVVIFSLLAAVFAVTGFAVTLPNAVWECDVTNANSIAWRSDYIRNPGLGGVHERRHLIFEFDVPTDGMYMLGVKDGDFYHTPNLSYNLDGKNLPSRSTGKIGNFTKVCNAYLEKGHHSLEAWTGNANWSSVKEQPDGKWSIWWKYGLDGKFAVIPTDGTPENSIVWDFSSKSDVERLGASFDFTVSAVGAAYDVFVHDRMDTNNVPVCVETFDFPADKVETKTYSFKPDHEGAYSISVKTKNGKQVQGIKNVIVVDVKACPDKVTAEKKLVFDVDCVNQTVNGEPLPEGMFYEANGPTRVVTTAAGTYRESHDSTPPLAKPMRTDQDPASFSAFAYHFRMPKVQVPYLVDIEFPDDDRRNVAVHSMWIDDNTGMFHKGRCETDSSKINSSYGKAYYTGGNMPLSMKMQHHNILLWAGTDHLMLPMVTQLYGSRAAASRIRIYSFENDQVPFEKGHYDGGRLAGQWSEEGANWRLFVNPPPEYGQAASTLIALNRWCQYGRWLGMNTINGLGIAYLNAFWRSKTLWGCACKDFDEIRLAALVCEKYGMYYIPDLFRATERHADSSIPKSAIIAGGKAEDTWAMGNAGERTIGLGGTGLNPFHPAVQGFWFDVMKELNGLLGDSPAFRGVTSRANSWFFQSDFHFASLHYGYGDWTVAEFEKDTGIKVPVANDDPVKYQKRYFFLTSADMKRKWIDWRAKRTQEYWKRLAAILAGGRDDVFFGPGCGINTEENAPKSDSLEERLAEAGITAETLSKPNVYWVGNLLDETSEYAFPALEVSASQGLRELGPDWDVLGLGLKPKNIEKEPTAYKKTFYGSTVFVPAGSRSLYKMAEGLAKGDAHYIRWGSNSDHAGDVAYWEPWLKAYSALPAEKFEKVNDDIVAVRFLRRGYIYAVNRTDYPAKVALSVRGATEFNSLGSGTKYTAKDGKLELDVAPFELIALKTDGTIEVADAASVASPEFMKSLHSKIAYLEKMDDNSFACELDGIWKAYREGRYADAYLAVTGDAALKACKENGTVPGWLNHAKFPNELTAGQSRKTHWVVEEEAILATDIKSDAKLIESSEVNPEWKSGKVCWSDSGEVNVELSINGEGDYTVRIGYAVDRPCVLSAEANGASLGKACLAVNEKVPEQAVWKAHLKSGPTVLKFKGGVPMGIYMLEVTPELRAIKNPEWSVIGPFEIFTSSSDMWSGNSGNNVQRAFEKKYECENPVNLDGTYRDCNGNDVRWSNETYGIKGAHDDALVPFLSRTGSGGSKMNFAVTYITADRDVELPIYIGCEWWANAYLNGEKVISTASACPGRDSGAEFMNWYPSPAVLKLKKGVNELLVKVHGGSFLSYFITYIGNDPGITLCPR